MRGLIIFCLITSLFTASAIADDGMKLVMLGTGTPNADPARSGPALAVTFGGKAYLVDAGPGVVRRAAAAEQKGAMELAQPNLDHVFITHLHSDHTLGLADLIFTPWVLERDHPLTLYGPTGSADMVDHLSKAYAVDVAMRLGGLEPANPDGYKVTVQEIGQNKVLIDTPDIRISAIPVLHGSWEEAYGFKFEAGGKTIVVSGDARPSGRLLEAARHADILVHEVYSDAGWLRREPVWQKYHKSFHTSATELAELANKAKPKLLVLTHQLYWGTSDEDLVKEIRAAGYKGALVSAKDLDIFKP
ncbi:MBL fold metallo-hydrolase [Kordiimonas lacus]|uniref:Ribonuclease BN, tRNA processing enzyme n=1 Tax=Kordiimonas lacus TaxID=637679 RepID=A0A1G7B0J7_9PROT|nr:MBL fold metallo-hydrolase [Kordiimonas lacus]SDE19766.1 Ribonuclease BN, tRNA processing enzyme [Kordiimonas lacus]